MKISEMNNEQAADVILRLSAPLANICDDEQITKLIQEYGKLEEGTTMMKVVAKLLPEIVTISFKTHRNDLFEIVGALTAQTREKAAKMNFLETIKVIKEAFADEDLIDFFTSFKRPKKRTAGKSAQD